jgi:hypothetical protein
MHYQPTQSAKGLGRHVVRSDGFGTCCEEAQFRFTSALGVALDEITVSLWESARNRQLDCSHFGTCPTARDWD